MANVEPVGHNARGSSGHRLFISAFMIHCDHGDDSTFTSRDDLQVVPGPVIRQGEAGYAQRSEQPETAVGSAQWHLEALPSRGVPAQATKLGITPKDDARAELEDTSVIELASEPNEWCVESTHLRAREGIGTQYYNSTVYNGNEPAYVGTLVARSEMSSDTRNILLLSNDGRATTSNLLGATRDALNTTGVECHESVASVPSTSAHCAALSLHRLFVLDPFHYLGSQLERASGEPDARAAPTRVRTRARNWLADLPPVQSVATDDLVPRGTRSSLHSSPAHLPSPHTSRLELGGLPTDSGEPGDPYRGSGDTQPSHATQDLNDARSSPAPSSKTERTTYNEERGERKEDREERSSEDEQGTQGQREEGYRASRKYEHDGSTTTGVATNEKIIVRPASHEDGTPVPRYDCEVVPEVHMVARPCCGTTSRSYPPHLLCPRQ
ncbi:uncharacterized protein B0H18DRAFT_360938 [Fomitopsis serialis]|uniref:uncharacterized protein n=1 Tax=Fomitopsis serialis TaxID=139415 RepID=UPI002007FF31|nr:uncharacterized protein B0H18DRAFT_360938 [Neoantrodia serialis]KAH9926046.1 hypothetical protein B0H18DRAFT_360938 [Neoantrodia serialis]